MSDLQSALERARLVAAKITNQLPDGMTGSKRPADSSNDDNSSKKFATVNDAVGAQLAMLKAQQMGGTSSEDIKVPDKLVGLIIGKGGECIHRLQSDTQCKITIAPDSNGSPDRVLSLMGSKDAIDKCKRAIDDILKRSINGQNGDRNGGGERNGGFGGGGMGGNIEVYEMRVPGNKCGLIIGKGGETIKRLSEQYGCKLVVVQETGDQSMGADKPLRITGEPDKVAKVKEVVLEMLTPKEDGRFGYQGRNDRGGGGGDRGDRGGDRGGYGGDRGGYGGYQGRGEYGGRDDRDRDGGMDRRRPDRNEGGSEANVKVPGDKAGIVIGKGGESIKDINRRSGAHVEIDKNHRAPEGGDKMFIIRGTPEQIEYAQQLIYEKITGDARPAPSGFFADPSGGGGAGGGYGGGRQGYGGGGGQQWNGGHYQQQQHQQHGAPGAGGAQGAQDPNVAAAWSAYYQQMYSAQGVPAQAAQPVAVAASPAAAAATPAAAAGTQPTINPQTGQADYSQAWVEYYQSLGMFAEADAILKQTQNGGSTPASAGGAAVPAASHQNGSVAANGGSNGNGAAALGGTGAGWPGSGYGGGAGGYQNYQQAGYNGAR